MTPTATTPVPRSGRVLDVASFGCLVAGALCYARAWSAMRQLEAGRLVTGSASHSAVGQFNQYWLLSRIGIALFGAGVVVAVTAAVVARWRMSVAPAA